MMIVIKIRIGANLFSWIKSSGTIVAN